MVIENLEADVGWNTTVFEGADELTPQRNKVLRTKLINKNLICVSGGNIYIFLTLINYSLIMCSNY